MSKSAPSSPRCIIIAGPNGAGKTTFAREFLSKEANIIHFVNPDLIASGLSPLRPELAALAAGRLFLRELHRLVKSRVDFAFESTLRGSRTFVYSSSGKLPVGASKWSICKSHHHDSRYDVSPRV
jgi:predicted ABC-type ATPase